MRLTDRRRVHLRRLALTAAAATLGALLAGPTPGAAGDVSVTSGPCAVTADLVNPCRPWLGAESNGYVAGADLPTRIADHESRIGRPVDIVHDYVTSGSTLKAGDVTMAHRADTILLVNWRMPATWAAAGGGDPAVNDQIDVMAASVKALGTTRIMFALEHEPEKNIVAGGAPDCPTVTFKGSRGTTADYVAMWRNVRRRFDAAGVDNVVWVMNYMGYPGFFCASEDLWPGDDLVDWVMWDPYPNAASFTDTVGAFYSELTARSRPGFDVAAKPWGLAEWGYAGTDQTKAYATYDEARRDLDSGVFPRLKAYVVWDNKVAGGNDDRVGFDNAGTADPTEQADYNAFAADPRLRDDVTAPTAPTSLAATLSRSTVALTWTAAQDAVGVAAYTVYRGGVAIGTSTTPGYTDATAPQGHRAVYTVSATDPSGNVGESASPLTVAVPDTTAPSRVAGLTATPGTGRITLAWRPATDNIGVTSYRVFRGSTRVATLAASARGFVNTGLRARTLYSYSVFARDASGNQSPAAAVSARTR